MVEYNLSVCLADGCALDDKLLNLIQRGVAEANSRRNASRKGRHFIYKGVIDPVHFHIILQSDSEVIPSRALSALTRSMLDIDDSNVVRQHIYRNSLFSTMELPKTYSHVSNLSDIEMVQELTSMIFGQSAMTQKNRNLSRNTVEKIRSIVIDYINQKSVT